MKTYLDLLKMIVKEGKPRGSARDGMPPTIGLPFLSFTHDFSEGFPLLTTKKMFFKGIVTELCWFLKGDTNIKYLLDHEVHIWDSDAYKYYLRLKDRIGDKSIIKIREVFIETVRSQSRADELAYNTPHYTYGDCGKIYGYTWNNPVNQVQKVIDTLNTNPYNRYLIIDGWVPEIVYDKYACALPPCHLLYQFYFEESNGRRYLSLFLHQRSCDMFLGVPFNIASASLLLMIVAHYSNCIPKLLKWHGGDCHIYADHLMQVNEQLLRIPYNLPKVVIEFPDSYQSLEPFNFKLDRYNYYPPIKAPLSVGV